MIQSIARFPKILKGSPALLVLLYRAVQAFVGGVTLGLSVAILAGHDLGFFQTMSSLAALYMVLDMGLTTVLVQLTAARFQGAGWRGSVVRPSRGAAIYLPMCKSAIIWYAAGGLVFTLLFPIGVLFLRQRAEHVSMVWVGPWFLLVMLSAVQMFVLPFMAVLEGAGRLSEVYLIRLLQLVAGASLAWMVLLCGGGLWAVAMMPLAAVSVGLGWLVIVKKKFMVQIYRSKAMTVNKWKLEVWPLQWRSGVGWLAGYAQVLIHVPLLFATQGAIAAGQMGTTMTVVNTLSVVAMAWVVAQVPAMVTLAAQHKWLELDRIFIKACRRSFIMYLVGAMGVLVLMLFVQQWKYSDRFLPLTQTLIVLVAIVAYHMASIFAAFIRVHLKDPLVGISLLCAVLTISFSYGASSKWGTMGTVGAILLVNGFVYLPSILVAAHRIHIGRSINAIE